ncbi:MAG TPA: DUF6174 domain-containing protein [Isosphaeraceae bacterium]|jgi:hypothetical protein|nr:DUF6174 domain-containing protein [Isosphaeraceae bacterium]
MAHHTAVLARLALVAILLTAAGCAGGQNVTPEAIAQAKSTWQQAHILNYNIEWTSSGQMRGHYRVSVRGGKVTHVMSVLPDGREIEMRPGRPSSYGVDGLFQVIEEEQAQIESDSPFGQPKGTKAVLRFTTDPKLGYPSSYRRDLRGTPQGVSIDVIRFDPNPPDPSA